MAPIQRVAPERGPDEAMNAAEVDLSENEDDDEDDGMVFMQAHYQGDGRKREAKRHKSRAVVTQDEIDLEEAIKNYQNTNPKIMELESKLEELKTLKLNKRDLQSKRNRLTAQLSRDR